jgi:anti-sigma regulatory factor (Ser/Thr protein kinase)
MAGAVTGRRRFANEAASVRAARQFALSVLPGYPEDVLEVVELLVAELAGNCVRHTGSSFELSVTADAQRIQISVSDRGGGRPVVGSLDPTAIRGRGLALVEMLSDSWGVRYRPMRGGKSVWFTLRIEQPPARSAEVA